MLRELASRHSSIEMKRRRKTFAMTKIRCPHFSFSNSMFDLASLHSTFCTVKVCDNTTITMRLLVKPQTRFIHSNTARVPSLNRNEIHDNLTMYRTVNDINNPISSLSRRDFSSRKSIMTKVRRITLPVTFAMYKAINIINKTHDNRRYISIFDTLVTKQKTEVRSWHDPSFMENESPEDKELWLKSLLSRDKISSNINYSEIDASAYYVVLNGWATSDLSGAPQKAEEWIGRLERHYATVVEEIWGGRLNNSEIEGGGGGGVTTDANGEAIKSPRVLNDNSNNFDVDSTPHHSAVRARALEPTVHCYNAVIEAWSRSKKPIVARAERWLNKMKAISSNPSPNYNNIGRTVYPNTESYNLFLKTLSKGHEKKAEILKSHSKKAEDVLREMIVLHEEGQFMCETEKMQSHVIPNTDSFNYVIRAFTRCRTDPEIANRVMDLLRVMELYQRTCDDPDESLVKPNTMSYCMAIDAWCVLGGQKAKIRLMNEKRWQNNRSLSSNMLNNSGNKLSYPEDWLSEEDVYEDIKKAEELLKYMHDLNDSGNVDVVPNTVAYNTIIGGYARVANEVNSDAPLRAEAVLRRMIDIHHNCIDVVPDTISYNHVIRSWARVKRSKSGDRAEWWLRKMWEESNDFHNHLVRPNVHTYNVVLEAYQNIGEAKKAEALLSELLKLEIRGESEEDTSNDDSVVKIRANSESFSLVIRTWLKYVEMHDGIDAVKGCRRAYKWLAVLLQREESGDQGYSSSPELFAKILKVASNSTTTTNQSLFEVALKTFSKLKSSRHHVDALSYQWLLEIGLRTMSGKIQNKKRQKFLKHIITSCCDDGLVSNGFVSTLAKYSVSRNGGWTVKERREIFENYFGEWPLPNSWSRNINETHFLPTRKDLEQR